MFVYKITHNRIRGLDSHSDRDDDCNIEKQSRSNSDPKYGLMRLIGSACCDCGVNTLDNSVTLYADLSRVR